MGQMLFTGNMLWQTGPGAIMMAPVAFAMLMLTLAVAMLLFYLCLQRWLQRQNSSYASLEAASPAKHSKQADLDLYSAGFGGDDSANEQSDGTPRKPWHKQLGKSIWHERSSDRAYVPEWAWSS